MILTFLLLLLMSNGLTIRPDSSILYSRIGMVIIFYGIISAITSLHLTYLQKGIGLYGGLFNVTCITHTFHIFILLICGIILMLTGFYPRKSFKGDSSSFMDTLISKRREYIIIINKMSEQFTYRICINNSLYCNRCNAFTIIRRFRFYISVHRIAKF